MNIVVSVSDAQVSADPADQIVTYSLGSCIGVSAYDPAAQVAGMLHYQLPTSTMDANRAKQNPLMFADTGMACLLAAMERAGAKKNRL
ncbi:MAG TPA: chemotaxis protein CheD, partial [Tepidisphaeraceae bacterium]|nr:chemotaxis protein CheD [Tepidisphaeraceae bacterium]